MVRQIQELRKSLGKQTPPGATSINSAAPAAPATPAPTASTGSSTATATADVPGYFHQATATTDENSTAEAVASDGSQATASAVDGHDGTAAAAASASGGGSPADTLSDEKLINLFLLMAGRTPNWPGGGGAGGSGGGSMRSTGTTQAAREGGGSEHEQDVDVDAVSGLTARMSIDGGMDAPSTSEEQRFAAGPNADGSSSNSNSNGWGRETQLARADQHKADVRRQCEHSRINR